MDLQEIYDEFNYGIADPRAIRAFLGYAYRRWPVRPRYVVLAGQGSFDYKDYTGHGDCLVPPLMVNTPYGLFASDVGLADVSADGVPEMGPQLVDDVQPEFGIYFESFGSGGYGLLNPVHDQAPAKAMEFKAIENSRNSVILSCDAL